MDSTLKYALFQALLGGSSTDDGGTVVAPTDPTTPTTPINVRVFTNSVTDSFWGFLNEDFMMYYRIFTLTMITAMGYFNFSLTTGRNPYCNIFQYTSYFTNLLAMVSLLTAHFVSSTIV